MSSTTTALLLLAAATPLWSRARATSNRLAALTETNRASTDGASTNRISTDGAGTDRASTNQPGTDRTGTGRTRSPSPRTTRTALAIVTGLLVTTIVGWPLGPLLGVAVATATWWLTRRLTSPRATAPDPLAQAATWDLLAACLRAGLPVPTAVAAVADDLPSEAARALRATGDLLAMGADPVDAWTPAMRCPHTAALARAARHTARSGTALADVVGSLATTVRDGASDAAEARAQRAAVFITAPLGACFLPAFICLGIAPAVIGLATQLPL